VNADCVEPNAGNFSDKVFIVKRILGDKWRVEWRFTLLIAVIALEGIRPFKAVGELTQAAVITSVGDVSGSVAAVPHQSLCNAK